MPPLENEGDQTPDTAQTPGADADGNVAAPGPNSDAAAQQPDPQSSSGGTDPAAAGAGEPKTMAEAIEAAMKAASGAQDKKDEPAAASAAKPSDNTSAAAEKSDGTVETDDNGEGDDDPTDEELASYRPATQKRIKKLLSQRNAYRREAEEYRTDAGHYRNIRAFMQANDLQDREVAELFELGAHLKSGDPERLAIFLDRVMPRIQAVMEATGRTLPHDLREKVEAGELTEDMAKQLGRERAARAAAEAKATRATQTVQVQQDQVRVQAIREATAAWEAQVRAKDADFDMKAEAMKRAAQALVAERGLPKTPQQALEYAQAAYEEVNKWFSAVRPAPKATRPAPASGPSASRTGLSPAPSSLEEAIRWGLEAGARR